MQSVSTRCTASGMNASNNHETRQSCCIAAERSHQHTRKQTNKQTNKTKTLDARGMVGQSNSFPGVRTNGARSSLSGAKIMNS